MRERTDNIAIKMCGTALREIERDISVADPSHKLETHNFWREKKSENFSQAFVSPTISMTD